jgi:uncharacterized protein YndB with AHSA1/START domain
MQTMRDHGTLDQVDAELWRLRFTRQLPHPPEKVWRALTEPEHLSAWFPTDIEGERKPGARLHFVFRKNEGDDFDGEMLTVDEPTLLEFRWGPDDTLRFELEADGEGGTTLHFTNVFRPLGKAARDGAGWHHCLDNLVRHLAGQSPDEDRWSKVHPDYVERFGPEAATLGPPAGQGGAR